MREKMDAILGFVGFVLVFSLGYALGHRRAEIKADEIIRQKNIEIDCLRFKLKAQAEEMKKGQK